MDESLYPVDSQVSTSSTAIAIAGKKSYQQPEDTEFPFLRGNWPVLLHLSRSWRTPSSEKQFTKSRKSIKSDELRSFSPAVVTSYENRNMVGSLLTFSVIVRATPEDCQCNVRKPIKYLRVKMQI